MDGRLGAPRPDAREHHAGRGRRRSGDARPSATPPTSVLWLMSGEAILSATGHAERAGDGGCLLGGAGEPRHQDRDVVRGQERRQVEQTEPPSAGGPQPVERGTGAGGQWRRLRRARARSVRARSATRAMPAIAVTAGSGKG